VSKITVWAKVPLLIERSLRIDYIDKKEITAKKINML
jgi:hypothetical protein